MKFSRDYILVLLLLLAAIIGALSHYFFGYSDEDLSGHAWGSDDAYISYRYAANLASGHGLVFNPGERVEGYSNFLYVLIASLFYMVHPDCVYIGCFILNCLALLATLSLFYFYLKAQQIKHGILALAVICLCPLLWAWPASGLETSFVLLIHLALFISADYDSSKPSLLTAIWFCALAGFSVMMRADGFIFPLICTSAYFIRLKWRKGFINVGVVLLFFAIYIGARYSYYGYPLPNTYYAKVTGTLINRIMSAFKQLFKLFGKDAFFLYLLPFGIGWGAFVSSIRRKEKYQPATVPLGPVIAVGLLMYFFYVGGDVFQERFLLVLIPLSVAHLFQHAAHRLHGKFWIAGLTVIIALQFLPFAFNPRFNYHLRKYDRWVELGKYLKSRHPQATLAIDAAGKVPFYSKLPTLDMLGLNDIHLGHGHKGFNAFVVGHSKFDPDYVLEKKPDLIATWGRPTLDMAYGLSRRKYLPYGYYLKYVVNSSPYSRDVNIVDVTNSDFREILDLYHSGYIYFVITNQQTPGRKVRPKTVDHGRLDVMLSRFLKALRDDPDNPALYNNIGNVYAEKGQANKALAAYKKAIEVDPTYAKVYRNLSVFYLNVMKDKDKAEYYMEKYKALKEID